VCHVRPVCPSKHGSSLFEGMVQIMLDGSFQWIKDFGEFPESANHFMFLVTVVTTVLCDLLRESWSEKKGQLSFFPLNQSMNVGVTVDLWQSTQGQSAKKLYSHCWHNGTNCIKKTEFDKSITMCNSSIVFKEL